MTEVGYMGHFQHFVVILSLRSVLYLMRPEMDVCSLLGVPS